MRPPKSATCPILFYVETETIMFHKLTTLKNTFSQIEANGVFMCLILDFLASTSRTDFGERGAPLCSGKYLKCGK